MLPKDVISDCEVKANAMMENGKPKNWMVGSLIIFIWIVIILWLILKVFTYWIKRFDRCVVLHTSSHYWNLLIPSRSYDDKEYKHKRYGASPRAARQGDGDYL